MVISSALLRNNINKIDRLPGADVVLVVAVVAVAK